MRTFAPVLFGLFMACEGDGRVPTQQRTMPSSDDMLKENRDAVKLEDHDIELFAKRIGLELTPTARGVRYHLLRDMEGPKALAGQWALFPELSPWIVAAVVVVLFRVFDILKPPPVRQLESLPGGAGIMLDDAAAGVMAWVCGTLLLLAATAIWA